MYRLRQGLDKKFVYVIFIAIVAIAGYYLVLSDDGRREIPILYPTSSHYKSIAQNQSDLVSNDADRTIYENFVYGAAKKHKAVRLLPDPEAPVLLPQNSGSEQDAFGAIISEKSSQVHTTTIQTEKIITKEQGVDSIWDNIEEALGNSEPQIEPQKEITSNAKALNITNITNGKQSSKAVNNNNSQLFYVQLAYSRSKIDSQNQWNKIKANNKKLLQNSEYRIAKQKKEKAIFYELLLGPFPEFKDAKQLCRRIKLEKSKCLVVKK